MTDGKDAQRSGSVADVAGWGRVALPGVDLELSLLALLIRDDQRASIGIHELHLDLAIFAVMIRIGGNVADTVFVSQAARHVRHDAGNLAIEPREPGAASGHLRKSLELI